MSVPLLLRDAPTDETGQCAGDRPVALNGVVAHLAEEHVVSRPAGEIVVAVEVVGGHGTEGEVPVGPGRRAGGIGVERSGVVDAVVAVGVVDARIAGPQRSEARVGVVAEVRAGAVEGDIVAEDEVLAGAAVDEVVAISADEDILAVVAEDAVAAAQAKVGGRRGPRDPLVEGHGAEIAEDQIVPRAGVNKVAGRAA